MNELNIGEQTPATKNPIQNNKPAIQKTKSLLQGYSVGSMNGGLIRPIGWKRIMAGEKCYSYNKNIYIKMLTPLTPNYQKLKMIVKAYFVPDSRVWTNAERFYAQKNITAPNEMPSFKNMKVDAVAITNGGTTTYYNYFDTQFYRDSYISGYMPRIETGVETTTTGTYTTNLPPISVLPIRGFKAIYNDFERDKRYDAELSEFKSDTVSTIEKDSYFLPSIITSDNISANTMEAFAPRGKRQDSYYTNYRTMLADTSVTGAFPGTTATALTFEDWLKKIAEARQQAENISKNDWDIIAEMGGTRRALEGKVQLLGVKEIGLNFTPVTQNAYNTNQTVTDDFQTLGQQGAYSFTQAKIELFNNYEFIENGTLHIIAQVTTDTIFETGIDRTALNITYDSVYRPEMKDIIDDKFFKCETSTEGASFASQTDYTAIHGYKRKYNELFKLPNVIQGDITKNGYIQGISAGTSPRTTKTLPQKTYAYLDGIAGTIKYWKDFTDIRINENQAIQQITKTFTVGTGTDIRVIGQNQIYFMGIDSEIVELPVDEDIKKNFTVWGEV